MIRSRLEIAGRNADIGNVTIRQNKQSNNLFMFDNRQVNVTDNFILLDNQNNAELFNYINIASSNSRFQTTRPIARLYISDMLVFEGRLKIDRYIYTGREIGYRCRLLAEFQNTKELLENTSLIDLDYSGLNHIKTEQLVADRLRSTTNTDYTYALFESTRYTDDRGNRVLASNSINDIDFTVLRVNQHLNYTTSDSLEFPDMQPVLYTSWVIARISDIIGKNFTGGIFVDPEFTSQVYSLNKAVVENPRFNFDQNGRAVDESYSQINFEDLVHDVSLWVLFNDFLISFGLVFQELETSIAFKKISDVVNDVDDWNDNFSHFTNSNYDVPDFGQNSEFTYELSRLSNEIKEFTGVVNTNEILENGLRPEFSSFTTSINNQNLPINETIYESKFFNQFTRVYSAVGMTQRPAQESDTYATVEYTRRQCSYFNENELYFTALKSKFNEMNVENTTPIRLVSYGQMAEMVNNDNSITNANAEAIIRQFYQTLEGDAQLQKWKIETRNTDLTLTNILNRTNGAFPNNSYIGVNYGLDDYNILRPVQIQDLRDNNTAWFNIISNFKAFTAMVNLSLLDFYRLDLNRVKYINGSLFYVNRVNKYVPDRLTEVELIKVR